MKEDWLFLSSLIPHPSQRNASLKEWSLMKQSALLLTLLLAPVVLAADWTQFRGPGGSGIAPDKDLPTEWGADTNLKWKVTLPGRGVSNPVIADGRIFLTANSGWQQKKLHVLCFDEK